MKKWFLILLAALLALGLSGCAPEGSANEAKEWFAGGEAAVSDPVDSLDISWVDGSVTIAYADQTDITIAETAPRKLSSSQQLRWTLEGTTLRIMYAEAGQYSFDRLQKRLTVTLPKDAVLKRAQVSASSGDISAQHLAAEIIKLDATSGNVNVQCTADSLTVNTTSGLITLQAGANDMSLNTTSGGVNAIIERGDEVSVNASSGHVTLNVREGKSISFHGTSGGADVQVKQAEKIELTSTSGNLRLMLDKALGFTADATATSGKITMGVTAVQQGDIYVYGDGSTAVHLSATSGNITVEELK